MTIAAAFPLLVRSIRRLLSGLALALPLSALAAPAASPLPAAAPDTGEALWLRTPAISPDGQQIAFAYQGSLWLVPAAGGAARVLIANGGLAYQPVWSPDGRELAYVGDVQGNADVYVVPAAGGASRRLTRHSAFEVPIAWDADGRSVLFVAQRQDSARSLSFPGRALGELYRVPAEEGRRPVLVSGATITTGSVDATGARLVYEDWKGYENRWRKHQHSPVTHDLWIYDFASGRHRRLTDDDTEDRGPVWSADGRQVWFLSERGGSFNVWSLPVDKPEAAVQVTRFARHPVRSLSVSRDGTLAFGWDGALWTLAPGASEPRRLTVQVAADAKRREPERLLQPGGATEMAVSPDGSEVAVVVRGDVFVSNVEFGTTRRITATPGPERSVSFGPDGRTLLYAGEADGSWNLYEARLPGTKRDVPAFATAARVDIRTLLKNGEENFQPRYSPDGKEVAYLENRTTLKVLTPANGRTRTVLPGELNYSYEDGDQSFEWSPDGRRLLVGFLDRERWSNEVGLVDASGQGPLLNLSRSGYEDQQAQWAHGGRMVIWRTDRLGLRGSSGDAEQDVWALYLTREAWDRSRLDRAEFAQQLQREAEDRKAKPRPGSAASAPAKPGSAASGDGADAPEPPVPVKVDVDGLEDRGVRLTTDAGRLRATLMSPDGETLYYVLQSADRYELWVRRWRADETRRAASFPAGPQRGPDPEPVQMLADARGETAFVLADGAVQKFKLPKSGEGELKLEPVKFNAEGTLDRAAERAALYEHVWRQTRAKLYRADMGGVDWSGLGADYLRFLPHIANGRDFAELLSELLGELNVSHTGANWRPKFEQADETASLGLYFDEAWTGAGLKVVEVIDGGPFDRAASGLRAGMVIERLDGVTIAPGADVDGLLNRRAGQRLAVGVLDPATGRRFDETVKPIAPPELAELQYKRWVRRERAAVERLSGGKLGYVHVRGMDDESFRDVFADALGRHSAAQALVVDTRYNGGGNLHDDLTTFLSGRRYLEAVPRGQSIGWEPAFRWTRPSAVLISESNYSDAHLFPWLYRHLQIGPLVGMPVAGTGTAVWWELLHDRETVFGIPEVGFRDAQGRWMETERIDPDVRAPLPPERLEAGDDAQLEAVVKLLLERTR